MPYWPCIPVILRIGEFKTDLKDNCKFFSNYVSCVEGYLKKGEVFHNRDWANKRRFEYSALVFSIK